jgi:S1-C subfamily serine protease
MARKREPSTFRCVWLVNGKLVSIVVLAFIAGFVVNYAVTAQLMANLQDKVTASQGQIADLGIQISGLRDDLSRLRSTITTLNITTRPFNQSQYIFTAPAKIYQEVKDSVVLIDVTLSGGEVLGSGFIYDPAGHVVTNQHVVDGAISIEVTFADGSSYPAKSVGEDRYSDLAVVLVDAPRALFKPLVIGNSSGLEVGTPIMAIGNPFGLSGSLTIGVVSQMGRTLPAVGGYSIPNVIQIDAAVNPGNSGGPLLDYDGEMVGITTAIESETGSFSGIGYAIPSNTVQREVPYLISSGHYDHSWLGVQGMDLGPEIMAAMKLNTTRGWLIVDVTPNGPADKAGLRGGTSQIQIKNNLVKIGGDVFVSMDGVVIRNGDDISNFLEMSTRPGQMISVTIIRGGVEIKLSITLGVRPPPPS